MKFMKIVPFALIFLLIVSFVSYNVFATEILSELVEIGVGDSSKVSVTINYTEITSNKLSYLIPYNIQRPSIKDRFGALSCQIEKLRIGTEFLCDPREKENYEVFVNYETTEMVSQKEGFFKFYYEHQILDPTQKYEVVAFLPEGFGLLTTDSSLPSTSPIPENIGSTGRRILIRWEDEEVILGDTISKIAWFESVGIFENISYLIWLPILLIALAFFAGILLFRKKKTNNLLFALKEDERRVVSYVQEQGGKCRQRDIVRDLNLSKAKASRLITDLEERGLLIRIKRGRNNIIRLEKQ